MLNKCEHTIITSHFPSSSANCIEQESLFLSQNVRFIFCGCCENIMLRQFEIIISTLIAFCYGSHEQNNDEKVKRM